MQRNVLRTVVGLLAIATLVSHAYAQSSLGIGTAEPSIAPSGPFAHFLQWVNIQQQDFYRSMTRAMTAMRDNNNSAWLLVGLSFLYGIFHAAGPGHGKVVISTYMLANETALRRGIILSIISSLLQAVSAIVMIGTVYLVLRGTSISMTQATGALEIMSYALIAAFGAMLLWRKLRNLTSLMPRNQALAVAGSGSMATPDHHDHSQDHGHHHEHAKHDNHGHKDHHGHAHAHHDHHHHDGHDHATCSSCGHSHAPDPKMLSGDDFNMRGAWAAIIAVGIRPCSGALIVLSFALLNGLWLGGILSVFAMAIGTAITVSLLATLAVTAKDVAVRLSGGGALSGTIHSVIEIAGAAVLLLLGLTLLAASLTGPLGATVGS